MGPIDLTRDLGMHEKYGFPQVFDSPEFKNEICKHVLDCCGKYGDVAVGNFAVSREICESMLGQGFTFLATGTDVGLLEQAVRENTAFVKEMKKKKNVK